MLMALQDCLADWTAEVVRQIKSLPGSTETWNATSAAAELLGVGACLAGGVKPDGDLVELLNSALGAWPDEGGAQAPALQQVYKRLLSHREKLVSLVRAVNSGTKGGQAGGFLDPGVVVPALASVRRGGWRLTQVPPESGTVGDWALLAKIYQEIARELEPAATSEKAARLDWLSEVEQGFGPDSRRADIAKAISAARDAAVAAGLAGPKATTLRECLDQFGSTHFDEAVRSAAALRGDEDALSLLAHYGRARTNATGAANALIKTTREFLETVEAELSNVEAQFGDEGSVQADLTAITATLSNIHDDLSRAWS